MRENLEDMMDDKRLLCAFVYGAVESKHCGSKWGKEQREEYLKKLRDYISSQSSYYPEKELNEMPMISKGLKSHSIREHVYFHTDAVREVIKSDYGIDLKDRKFQTRDNQIYIKAVNCFTRIFKVNRVDLERHCVYVWDNFLRKEKELYVLGGLEFPAINDEVSAHYNGMLEVIDRNNPIMKRIMQQYEEKLKRYGL